MLRGSLGWSVRWKLLLRNLGARFLPLAGFFCAAALLAQQGSNELSGADAYEHSLADRKHLFGDWDGERKRLSERGVDFDIFYISDFLSNVRSAQGEHFAIWDRVRGVVDVDFSRLTDTPDLTFHATGLWQTGFNPQPYLGTIANPSSLTSKNLARFDTYWLDKRWSSERVAVRVGVFGGQDFFGAQPYSSSFVIEPLGYALGNLNSTYESAGPPATPALALRIVPLTHFYFKAMVFAADRNPLTDNPTGFVPRFRGSAAVASEVGWTLGYKATSEHVVLTVAQRRGYSGTYRFGSVVNTSKFKSTGPTSTIDGNYLIYAIGSQALWRTAPNSGVGLDLTVGADWTPPNRSLNNQQTTVGLRYNEPARIRQHNTIGFGYVRSSISAPYAAKSGLPRRPEHALEFNARIELTPSIMVQPVVEQFLDAGGTSKGVTIVGFRVKVDF